MTVVVDTGALVALVDAAHADRGLGRVDRIVMAQAERLGARDG